MSDHSSSSCEIVGAALCEFCLKRSEARHEHVVYPAALQAVRTSRTRTRLRRRRVCRTGEFGFGPLQLRGLSDRLGQAEGCSLPNAVGIDNYSLGRRFVSITHTPRADTKRDPGSPGCSAVAGHATLNIRDLFKACGNASFSGRSMVPGIIGPAALSSG